MFKKMSAFPNGIIKYYYGDKVITETKEGVITINYNEKNINGIPTRIRNVRPSNSDNFLSIIV